MTAHPVTDTDAQWDDLFMSVYQSSTESSLTSDDWSAARAHGNGATQLEEK